MSTARALATPTWRTSTGGGARRRRLRRDDGERRSSARAFQGAEIPDDLLEAAKNGMGTFMERVRGRRASSSRKRRDRGRSTAVFVSFILISLRGDVARRRRFVSMATTDG